MENTAYPNSRSVKQAIEQACNEIYHLNKHLRVSHPSRADAVEADISAMAKAYEAGVTIAMGTDAGVMPHGTNLRELSLMCDVGMTAMESIVATTKTAAECLGWEDKIGTLEAGKLADVIITDVDPLADIRQLQNTDHITLVLKDGQIMKDIRA
jgi:imidazolonepropionase-like amidohydrolase